MHFLFYKTYNSCIKKNGGAFMITALCIGGIMEFLSFIKMSVFAVGYISR